MRLTKAQKAAITALEDIKARDITTLDTRKLTAMYDALIIATADSARQTKALARNVHDKVKAAGGTVLSTEGEDTGEWVLVDCADFVVHIMQPAARALYNLEELWTPPAPRKRSAGPKTAPAPGAAASAEGATTQATPRPRSATTACATIDATAAKAPKAVATPKAATIPRAGIAPASPRSRSSPATTPTPATKTAKAPGRKRTAAAPAAPTAPKATPRSTSSAPAAPRVRRRVVE